MKRALGRFLLGLVFIPIAIVVNVLDLLFWPLRQIHRFGNYVYDGIIAPSAKEFREIWDDDDDDEEYEGGLRP